MAHGSRLTAHGLSRCLSLVGSSCLCFSSLFLESALAQADPPATKPKTVLEQANADFKANRFAVAADLLSKSLQSDPSGPDSAAQYLLLGQALAKQNLTDNALRTFSSLVTRYPNTEWAPQAIEQQIVILQGSKLPNPSEIEKLRKQLLESYPDSPTTAKVWSAIADGLFEAEKLADALIIYRRIEKSLPPESEKRFRLAEILVQSNADPAKVLEAAERALKENRITLAKTLLKRIIEEGGTKPQTNEYRVKYAWCLYVEGGDENLTEAEHIWSSIAKQEPRGEWGSASRWHLVQLHAGPKNEWRKAVDLCASLAADMPKGSFRHEQALFTRAWLLRTHKEWSKAKVAFAELVREYPTKASHEPIIQYIGEIDENLQNPKESTAK